ncbi:MAG: amidohydrolase family protein [Candidatus Brocadiae bacterium]|nr:amidohydrolase family protein [Candidatus Brocadiia bacterium]
MLIDVHAHIGRIGHRRTDTLSAAQLVAKMDAWGIDRACVLPLADCPEGWYLHNTTDDVLAACAAFPDRLIPFCLVDPRFGDATPRTDFGDLLAEYRERGCVGIGEFIPNLPFDDPLCMNLYRQAGEAGLPVLFDLTATLDHGYGVVDDPGLSRLERALRECGDTAFIGHGPAFWSEISASVPEAERGGYPQGPVVGEGAVPRLMGAHPNLWADLSAGSGHNAITRDPAFGLAFLHRFQDKLLFGTDVLRHDQAADDVPIVATFQSIRDEGALGAAACEKIAHANAVRLFGLDA